MDPTEGEKYVDHIETVISASRPRQLSAQKVDITAPMPDHSLQVGQGFDQVDFQVSVPRTEGGTSCEDGRNMLEACSAAVLKVESTTITSTSTASENTASVTKSVVAQESSSTTTKSQKPTSPNKVQTYATSVYAKRIGGARKSKQSDSGDSDVSSPPTPPSKPISPEVSSVQFEVQAGVGSSSTTVLSKMFTKTVETTLETSAQASPTQERHLSECSFSIGGPPAGKVKGQQSDSDDQGDDVGSSVDGERFSQQAENQEEATDNDAVFTEDITSVKGEEEKEVAEYCPGLAIRTLALEDLQEKRLSPERDDRLNSDAQQLLKSTDMSTSTVSASQPSTATTNQERGWAMSAAHAADSSQSISMPVVDVPQEGLVVSSEHGTSQLEASSESTSVTKSPGSSSLTSGGQVLMQCTEDCAASLRKPLFNPMEVERTFSIDPSTEERLRSLGARLHKEKTFTDVYYDNDQFALIVTDCWLRRRNDTWQAKIPLQTQETNAVFAPASQYKEVSNEKEISTWLVGQLGLDSWMRGDPIDLLVQAAGLTQFTRLTTVRRSYTLPSCMVDLLMTDNGVQVGEIDVMAASPEELPQALNTIGNVAQQLERGRSRKQLPIPSQPAVSLTLLLICHVFISRLANYIHIPDCSVT